MAREILSDKTRAPRKETFTKIMRQIFELKPEPKAPGELLGWVTVRPSVVVVVRPFTFFKLHLLLNHWMDSNQTWQKWSLGGPLSKLFKEFDSMQNSGCYGNKREKSTKTFKNLLVRNQKAQVFDIWYVASSSGPLPKLFKL